MRSAAEYDAIHIRGSYHVPLPTLAEHTDELAAHLADGARSSWSASPVSAPSRPAATSPPSASPTPACWPAACGAFDAAGGDVVRGRQAWALERQVRLAAGALVVTGLAAGRLVSPKARLLAAGIGTGLTVSALTDTCAMGAALARLPWNRDRNEPSRHRGARPRGAADSGALTDARARRTVRRVVGALLGLVGGGGGILAVPALVYGLGLPLSAAVPASLVVIGLASAVAVAPRARRGVNWRLAGVIGAAGVPTAVLGGVVNHQLDQHVLLLVFAAIMVLAGVRMLRATDETGGVCDLPGGGVAWRRCLPARDRHRAARRIPHRPARRRRRVPARARHDHRPRPAHARRRGDVTGHHRHQLRGRAHPLPRRRSTPHAGMNWPVIAAFALAAIVASLPAGRLARRVPAAVLRRGFAVLVLLVAAGVTTQTLTTLIA